MGIDVGDYFAHRAFDPGLMDARLWQLQRQPWWQAPSVYVPPTPVLYEPAIPIFNTAVPDLSLYRTAVDAVVAWDQAQLRSPTQLLWDAIGLEALQRSPALSPVWAELVARSGGGGWVTSDVWNDYRRSFHWPSTNLYMRVESDRAIRRATGALTAMLRRSGRLVVRVVGKLIGLPAPTPASIALWAVREVGTTVALNYAAKGWKSLAAYVRETNRTEPLPPPVIGPWPPTAPPGTGGQAFTADDDDGRSAIIETFAGVRGMRLPGAPTGAHGDFLALVDGAGADPGAPFIATSDRSPGVAPHLLSLGGGLYR